MKRAIRILVADDHPIVRDGLAGILETQADFKVVGQSASGPETVREALRAKPDVIFLDLEMPGGDGLAAIAELRRDLPDARIVIFTAFDTDDRILGAIRAGAHGYLLKGAPRAEIVNAVRVVHAGGSLLQPVVASRLLDRAHPDPDGTLTSREIEVLASMAQGLTNKEIGQRLFISERTVKFHVSSILAKLGAGNRTEAVRIATQRRLIRPA